MSIQRTGPVYDKTLQLTEITDYFRSDAKLIKTQQTLQETYLRYSLISGIHKARHDTLMSVIRVIRP